MPNLPLDLSELRRLHEAANIIDRLRNLRVGLTILRIGNEAADYIEALLSRIETLEEENGWRPIETVRYGEEVIVRVGEMTFRAMLTPDASISESGAFCDQWQATRDGEHPPCWTDGACWESNADEVTSLQPEAWRPLPSAPTNGGER